MALPRVSECRVPDLLRMNCVMIGVGKGGAFPRVAEGRVPDLFRVYSVVVSVGIGERTFSRVA